MQDTKQRIAYVKSAESKLISWLN